MLRRTLMTILAATAVSLGSFTSAYAGDLRGRVDGRNPYYPHPFPISGVPVQLYEQRPQGWFIVASAYTGPDGMYYFRGIRPGQYVIQVQGMNFPLVVAFQPFQDIPLILVMR